MSDYDVYTPAVSKRMVRVVVKKGAGLPAGADPSKWKFHSTISASRLSAEAIEKIETDGNYTYEMNIEFKIGEA